jgi:hypothetical protein
MSDVKRFYLSTCGALSICTALFTVSITSEPQRYKTILNSCRLFRSSELFLRSSGFYFTALFQQAAKLFKFGILETIPNLFDTNFRLTFVSRNIWQLARGLAHMIQRSKLTERRRIGRPGTSKTFGTTSFRKNSQTLYTASFKQAAKVFKSGMLDTFQICQCVRFKLSYLAIFGASRTRINVPD